MTAANATGDAAEVLGLEQKIETAVVNQLRKHFGFEGAPVRIFYKPKRKRDEKKNEE